MPKRHCNNSAFTLIEVIVAVMIVSVVIAALLQMRGNTSYKFLEIKTGTDFDAIETGNGGDDVIEVESDLL